MESGINVQQFPGDPCRVVPSSDSRETEIEIFYQQVITPVSKLCESAGISEKEYVGLFLDPVLAWEFAEEYFEPFNGSGEAAYPDFGGVIRSVLDYAAYGYPVIEYAEFDPHDGRIDLGIAAGKIGFRRSLKNGHNRLNIYS